MIIWNTIRFEYYIIQQLFNSVNVPGCHTGNLSSQNIFIPFKDTLLLFSRFIFLDTNIKGTVFSGRVRSRPSHLPQLRAWELRDYLIQFCWDAVCITCFCLLFILDIQKQPPGVFCKKGVLRNFKINRKTPAPAESLAYVFSCEFCEISKNTVFTEHLRATASRYLKPLVKLPCKIKKSYYQRN